MAATLSIIILTCNQRCYTLQLLPMLDEWLKRNPGSELIIVDNGSTDGTAQAVMASPIMERGQGKYIFNKKNLGVAAGRNCGLKRAKGDYIMILDNDTEVEPEAIDSLMAYLESHPECGLCAPALVSPEGDLQDSAKPFPGLGIKVRHLLHKGMNVREREAMESGKPEYVIGACQLFRREITDEIGLLDEKIFYGPEDADWCLRIAATGKSIDYLPEIRIIHHWQRASNRSPFSRLARRHARALLYFYRKHRRLF